MDRFVGNIHLGIDGVVPDIHDGLQWFQLATGRHITNVEVLSH